MSRTNTEGELRYPRTTLDVLFAAERIVNSGVPDPAERALAELAGQLVAIRDNSWMAGDYRQLAAKAASILAWHSAAAADMGFEAGMPAEAP